MGMRLELSCDGCERTIFLEPGTESSEIRQRCLVSLNGRGDESYDLCTCCQQRLAEVCNPKSWPRASVRAAS